MISTSKSSKMEFTRADSFGSAASTLAIWASDNMDPIRAMARVRGSSRSGYGSLRTSWYTPRHIRGSTWPYIAQTG